MPIEWTPEAIEAWKRAYWKTYPTRGANIRYALDAAVKEQGVEDAFDAGVQSTFKQRAEDLECIYREGWNEAIEAAASYIGGEGGEIPGANAFAALVSGNPQPCMSGDARDRMRPHTRRMFDDATNYLVSAIRAIAKTGG